MRRLVAYGPRAHRGAEYNGLTHELEFDPGTVPSGERSPGKAGATRGLGALFHGKLDDLVADSDAPFSQTHSGFSFTHSIPESIATPFAPTLKNKAVRG